MQLKLLFEFDWIHLPDRQPNQFAILSLKSLWLANFWRLYCQIYAVWLAVCLDTRRTFDCISSWRSPFRSLWIIFVFNPCFVSSHAVTIAWPRQLVRLWACCTARQGYLSVTYLICVCVRQSSEALLSQRRLALNCGRKISVWFWIFVNSSRVAITNTSDFNFWSKNFLWCDFVMPKLRFLRRFLDNTVLVEGIAFPDDTFFHLFTGSQVNLGSHLKSVQ